MKNNAVQKHNIKSILFIKVLWTHISCNTKKSSFWQKQQEQIVNRFNQPQQGNALSKQRNVFQKFC